MHASTVLSGDNLRYLRNLHQCTIASDIAGVEMRHMSMGTSIDLYVAILKEMTMSHIRADAFGK